MITNGMLFGMVACGGPVWIEKAEEPEWVACRDVEPDLPAPDEFYEVVLFEERLGLVFDGVSVENWRGCTEFLGGEPSVVSVLLQASGVQHVTESSVLTNPIPVTDRTSRLALPMGEVFDEHRATGTENLQIQINGTVVYELTLQ